MTRHNVLTLLIAMFGNAPKSALLGALGAIITLSCATEGSLRQEKLSRKDNSTP